MPVEASYTDDRARAAMLPKISLTLFQLRDNLDIPSVLWNSRFLEDSSAVVALSWDARSLLDGASTVSLDWQDRLLNNSAGTTVYNWNTGTFTPAQIFSGTITNSTLTASRAVVSDGSKVLVSSATTATEIGYVNLVTGPIQAQLDAKASNGLAYVAQKGWISA